MEIPYTVKPRPDTGIYNAKVGIWLFLASEIMLFGALFSSYIILRITAPEGTWIEGALNVPIGFFNTLVLIFSSVTVVMAWASLKLNNFKAFQVYMVVTFGCAMTFLVVKSFEYNEKFHHYEMWTNAESNNRFTGHFDKKWLKETKKAYETKVSEIQAGYAKELEDWKATDKSGDAPNPPIYPEITFFTLTTAEVRTLAEFLEMDSVIFEKEGEHAYRYKGMPTADDHHHDEGDAHHEEGDAHASADGHDDHGGHHHETLTIPVSDIKRTSAFIPGHSNYFGIYFTLTGLHALHVFGGACVLLYFVFCNRKMWKEDPDRLANRVEVGGLFWHFVDLVWIFLFPIMYLL